MSAPTTAKTLAREKGVCVRLLAPGAPDRTHTRVRQAVEGALDRHADAVHGRRLGRVLRPSSAAIPIAQLEAWLALLGLPQVAVRPPLAPPTRDDELALRRDLEAAEVL